MKGNRVLYLDILRIIATIGVLANHIPLAAVHIYDKTATDIDRWLVNGNVHVMHFAVPVFVMITGALLLSPEKMIDYKKILTKYVWRMVVILALVGTVFAWMEIYFQDKHFALEQIPQAMLNTFEGHTWKHMWYLYMLVGLYLILPVLKSTVNTLEQSQLDCLIIIGFLFTCVMPGLEKFTSISVGVKFPVVSQYVFCLLLGYRMNKTEFYRWRVLMALLVLLMVAYITLGYLEYVMGYKSLTWFSAYNSPMMIFYSACVFLLFKSLPWKGEWLLTHGGRIFARDSFGIYVFHMLWVNVIYKVVKFNPIEQGLWTLVPILIAVTLLAWGTTIVFRKVPYVGRYI